MKWLFDKPCENEITLRKQNLSLICCQPLELLIYFGKGFNRVRYKEVINSSPWFRSLQPGNIGSLRPLQQKSVQVHLTRVQVRPGLNYSQSLTDSNFVAR